MGWLDSVSLTDETFILYLSDHGDALGDHHLWRKGYPFQQVARTRVRARAHAYPLADAYAYPLADAGGFDSVTREMAGRSGVHTTPGHCFGPCG